MAWVAYQGSVANLVIGVKRASAGDGGLIQSVPVRLPVPVIDR